MLKAAILALALSVGCGSSAYAITGAQLLSLPENYAQGFVWGAANVYGNLGGTPAVTALSRHRSECLAQGNVTDTAFVRSVTTYIENNPEMMTRPGAWIVHQVLVEMCGYPE